MTHAIDPLLRVGFFMQKSYYLYNKSIRFTMGW